jgi:hypothetical protein
MALREVALNPRQNFPLPDRNRLIEKNEPSPKTHPHTKDRGRRFLSRIVANPHDRSRMRLKPPRELVAFGGIVLPDPGGPTIRTLWKLPGTAPNPHRIQS